MKKLIFTIVALLLFIILVGCTSRPPFPEIPWDHLFLDSLEDNQPKIGRYLIERQYQDISWVEGNHYETLGNLFDRQIVCFNYFDDQKGIGFFDARSDYQWVEIKYKGNMCLELKRK